LVMLVVEPEWDEVVQLPGGTRGDHGLGHTGR
jgi:dUTPase